MSTIKVDTIQDTSGNEQFTAKAWVNFNGTGTVAIRADGNVSSLTDNGGGDYTVSFSVAIADANYAPVFGCIGEGGGSHPNQAASIRHATTPGTASIRVSSGDNGGSNSYGRLRDEEYICVAIFR